MTKLKFVNKFIFQWFFIRLTRHIQTKITDYNLVGFDVLLNNNGLSSQGVGSLSKTSTEWFSIQGFIVPNTGWNTDYKRIGKTWFLRLTKKREITIC